MTICNDLREAVLQAAIQGKLVEQRSEEGTGEELYQQIQAEKQKLIKAGKFKKEKPLSEITEDEIPFDIPESWIWTRVGDVGSWGSGATPSRTNPAYYGGSIPWLKTGDLNDGFIKEVPECITELALEKTSVRLNPVGSVLMAMYGATIGKLGILEIPVTTNQACCACIPYTGMYNKYLFYYLMSMRQTYIGMAEGGAQPNISKEKIVNSILPLPPLAEQKRIVAKIDELMAKIDDLEKTENELEMLKKDFPEDMKASILQAAVQGRLTEQLASDSNVDDLIENIEIYTKRKISIIENDEVPENWRTVKISDVSSLFTGNSISQNVKATKYTGLTEGYDYIGTKDVGFNHQIAYDNGVKIPYDEPNFRYAEKGDTLLCIEGGSAGKKIAISDKKVCFGNKLCAFHTININNKFLYYYLQSPLFLNYFTNNLSGIIGGVSINKIKQLSIPVPPIEEQQRIVDKLDQLLPLCEILQERVE